MNTAEEKLELIRKILFPEPLKQTEVNESGEEQLFHIDYSADLNLDAALNDIEDGFSDETVQKTIKDVSSRLYKIREILDEHVTFSPDINYFVVENLKHENEEVDI